MRNRVRSTELLLTTRPAEGCQRHAGSSVGHVPSSGRQLGVPAGQASRCVCRMTRSWPVTLAGVPPWQVDADGISFDEGAPGALVASTPLPELFATTRPAICSV